MTLILRFTRLNPTHHRFEAVRADGSRDVREFETRSLLLHDLVHFALESEAKLRGGFYGTLAEGANYDAPREGSEAQQIENVVGPIQGNLKNEIDPARFVARIKEVHAGMGFPPAPWLTADLIGKVLERLRQLQGQWKATPFGQTMELRFEA
ncbi:hypothetical protein [Terricaulis sp.]|uniref:hypothetical protein n=1 Tax=Terricaulis sp. TaxID=2768686 RepID=UPI0037849598